MRRGKALAHARQKEGQAGQRVAALGLALGLAREHAGRECRAASMCARMHVFISLTHDMARVMCCETMQEKSASVIPALPQRRVVLSVKKGAGAVHLLT